MKIKVYLAEEWTLEREVEAETPELALKQVAQEYCSGKLHPVSPNYPNMEPTDTTFCADGYANGEWFPVDEYWANL